MASAPLVFAHRGSSAALPEHTRAAYRRAIAEGADGLECDVWLSKDEHLICVHDATIDRTSDGRGRVAQLTLDELNRQDYTSWHPGGAQALADGEAGVLTLDALLRLALGAGRPLRLLVETKHPSHFGGEVERRVAELLERHGLHTADGARRAGVAVTVMSFEAQALRRVQALAPEVPTVFLIEAASAAPQAGFDALGPGVAVLRKHPELVALAHGAGQQVLVWTVNTLDDLAFVRALGVGGVISDRPAELLAALGRGPAVSPNQ